MQKEHALARAAYEPGIARQSVDASSPGGATVKGGQALQML